MQIKQLSLIFSLFLTLCVCPATQAQRAGRIESIKLLTADTGWAATNKKLFWTTDGGAQWKDITPKLNHKEQHVSSVFFLDASTGWVLLNCGDGRDRMVDDVCFEFALTKTAGENWSVVHPKIVDPGIDPSNVNDGVGTYSGTTFLDFADPQHGWAVLRKSYGLQRSEGTMLRTVDGGTTWTQLSSGTPPIADGFRFANPNDGWMVDGREGDLYASHDAGNSWQEASLPKPASIGPDTGVSNDLPVFVNERRGFLLARYAVGPPMGPDLSTLVLFGTGDGGRTWKEERVLPRLPDIYSSGLAGPVLVAAHSEQVKAAESGGGHRPAATRLSLYTLGPNQDQTSNTAEVSSQGAAIELSFVDRDQGWANLTDGLFATRDAGKTWVDVTPSGPAFGPVGARQSRTGASPSLAVGPASSAEILDPSSTISTHLGFDGYNVPTIPQMTAWIASSPFYDVYIYLPNSPNRHDDPILVSKNGPGWVSSIEGQGWGIVPVWFGLQSTCDKATNITEYISNTQTVASKEGAEEADQAVAQDQLLSITAGIIFLDIENYTPDHSTCSLAVQAYVDGFVSEIGFYSGYSAGVYANPAPITSDISQVSPAPAEIWIARYDGHVTIWNEVIKDTLWPDGQRMHQFLANTNPKNAPNATWGGVPLSIDYDIDDGPAVNANTFAKAYTYGTPAISNCPGVIDTVPLGINDMSNGVFINGPGQAGTVVGY
jgi:photosystem II stability/assembly factor-like uncharacterized protein